MRQGAKAPGPGPGLPAGNPNVIRQLNRAAGSKRLDPVGSLGYMAAVNVVIWVGLFVYLWRLDRRISEAERKS